MGGSIGLNAAAPGDFSKASPGAQVPGFLASLMQKIPFVSASVSGNLMTTDSNASSETLSNYSSTQTLDGGANQPLFTMIASGTLQTTRLSGSVSYTTPLMFEATGQNYPHTGELLVSGDNSSARLIAIDDVNVRIEIDSNGDGIVDETINTSWVELTA